MSRNEADREDLLREATGLVERAEFVVASFAEPIVAGFRHNGAVSFFFGASPVLQFNQDLQLRRAYDAGSLIKAEEGRLVELQRQRSAKEVALVRREWDPERQEKFLQDSAVLLARFRKELEQGRAAQRAAPAHVDLIPRLLQVLNQLSDGLKVAGRPHA